MKYFIFATTQYKYEKQLDFTNGNGNFDDEDPPPHLLKTLIDVQ